MESDIRNQINNNMTTEYLQELFRDRKLIQTNGLTLKHGNLLLDREISRVKEHLYQMKDTPSDGSDSANEGKMVSKQEKIFLPVRENPNYNFVGRILGPRGYTAKHLEQKLDCKIMIRGKGSMRDHSKEEQNRGKPNWEHLNQELHVLVSISDYENKIEKKIDNARDAINKFIEEGLNTPESQDTLKQMQLMELSILNENDRMQQQQRQQVFLQQSAALQINPNILHQNILKFPMMPLAEPTQDISHLLSNQDALQLFSLNTPWNIFNTPMIQQDIPLEADVMSNDQNSSTLLSFINNSNNYPYMNYNVPGHLKVRADQRNHPYYRAA